jgi:CheY-like chemotaxis protein
MTQPYILIIDDNRLIADNLVRMLKVLGLSARAVYGAPTAMQALNGPLPALVMLDLHMQGINGVEVCRFIRRNPATAALPVLGMSSDNQPDLIKTILDAGANLFLPKPVRIEDLEVALVKLGILATQMMDDGR